MAGGRVRDANDARPVAGLDEPRASLRRLSRRLARSRAGGFEIGAHVILGLPGESRDDMLATARELARLGIDAVKLHNLYAVQDTPLGRQVARGEVTLARAGRVRPTLVDFLELLPPTAWSNGSAATPRRSTWSVRRGVPTRRRFAAIEAELLCRDTWQGRLFADKENIE